MHPDQVDVSEETVLGLLAAQFPQWAELPVRAVESAGTVNAIFRIGEELTARFPLRPSDRTDVRSEQAAARRIARVCPVATPAPVAVGRPGPGYPMAWSISAWVPGTPATCTSHATSYALAEGLVDAIRSLRADDTRGESFAGDNRGGDLRRHDRWVGHCLEQSVDLLDTDVLAGMWATYRDLPRTSPDVMSHQDLVPGNVLADGQRLAGILDVGSYGPADPALDLVAAWHLFDAGPRELVREQLARDQLEWERGEAWALEQALGLVWYYRETNPAASELGRTTLRRLLEGR